jgi:hypothetical protein
MKKKFLKWGAPVLLVLFGAIIYVSAQTVIDSYNDQSKISGTWNVSTSTAGEIQLLPRTCDILNWYCTASTTCANFAGDGDYIIVAQADASTTLAWKNANTACDRPQCGADGAQSSDNLEESNLIDFSSYPARNYCKSIGARLPTREELSCMYTNRASFGNNFASASYWSATENSASNAWYRDFGTGTDYYAPKPGSLHIRCVRGW